MSPFLLSNVLATPRDGEIKTIENRRRLASVVTMATENVAAVSADDDENCTHTIPAGCPSCAFAFFVSVDRS